MDAPFASVPQRRFFGLRGQKIVILEHVEQVSIGGFQRIVDDAIVKSKKTEGVFSHALGNLRIHVEVDVLLNGLGEFCKRHSHLLPSVWRLAGCFFPSLLIFIGHRPILTVASNFMKSAV